MIAPGRKDKAHLLEWRIVYVSLVAFYLLVVSVVSLAGNFPLNDDWTYGLGVQYFAGQGMVYLPGACAAGLVHVLWGALFCKCFGFSYEILRCASVLMSLWGSLCLLSALRCLGLRTTSALVLTLVYAVNPLMLNITFSFMSDTTALALSAAFLAAYLYAIKKRSCFWFCMASLALALAITVRQSALFLSPMLLIWLFMGSQSRMYQRLLSFAGGIFLVVAAFKAGEVWLAQNRALAPAMVSACAYTTALHLDFLKLCLAHPLEESLAIVAACGQVLCYAALFVIPLWPGLFSVFWRRRISWLRNVGWSLGTALGLTGLSAGLTVFRDHRLMPFSENIWRVTSVGALGLMGIANSPPSIRQKRVLTALSYAGMLLLLKVGIDFVVLIGAILRRGKLSCRGMSLLACSLGLLSTAAFCTLETLVRSSDRYYLLLLAPMLLSIAALQKYWRFKINTAVALVLLTLYAGYSIFATQDYLSSNRARWNALHKLEAQGVAWNSIDGGAEYNVLKNWRIYGSQDRGEAPRCDWRWWPISGEKYIVSYSPIPDYETVSTEQYFSLLTMSQHQVFVLKQMIKPR